MLAMSSLELWRGGVLCDDIELLLMYVSISQAHGENYKRLEQESNVCARSQPEQHRHYIFIFSCKSVYPCVLHSHYQMQQHYHWHILSWKVSGCPDNSLKICIQLFSSFQDLYTDNSSGSECRSPLFIGCSPLTHKFI